MDPDLALVIGVLIGGFSFPAILGAFADGRLPRVALLSVILAGGFVFYAARENPGEYSAENIPEVFMGVIDKYLPDVL